MRWHWGLQLQFSYLNQSEHSRQWGVASAGSGNARSWHYHHGRSIRIWEGLWQFNLVGFCQTSRWKYFDSCLGWHEVGRTVSHDALRIQRMKAWQGGRSITVEQSVIFAARWEDFSQELVKSNVKIIPWVILNNRRCLVSRASALPLAVDELLLALSSGITSLMEPEWR